MKLEDDFLVFYKGSSLTADNEETKLVMEKEGNLALYCKNGKMIWESGTDGVNVNSGMVIQDDGNMMLFNEKNDKTVWESDSAHSTSQNGDMYLVVQNDNNLVLYNSAQWPMWATDTVNQCKDPKVGGCSGNSCTVMADGEDVILGPGNFQMSSKP